MEHVARIPRSQRASGKDGRQCFAADPLAQPSHKHPSGSRQIVTHIALPHNLESTRGQDVSTARDLDDAHAGMEDVKRQVVVEIPRQRIHKGLARGIRSREPCPPVVRVATCEPSPLADIALPRGSGAPWSMREALASTHEPTEVLRLDGNIQRPKPGFRFIPIVLRIGIRVDLNAGIGQWRVKGQSDDKIGAFGSDTNSPDPIFPNVYNRLGSKRKLTDAAIERSRKPFADDMLERQRHA